MRSSVLMPLLSSAVLASPAPWNPGWNGDKNPGWGWGSWGWGSAWGWGKPHSPPGYASNAVAYFLYNDPAGASVVSLGIGQDGKLMDDAMKTATGGKGSLQVESNGTPAMADTLGSQGSVCVKDNMLFTVNAGSDTISMFLINPQSPMEPKLVGTANTLGDWPMSVDYSPKLRKACVLNGGAKAGVTCFSVDPYHGLRADGPMRMLSKSIFNETTPPSGPPNSAAQVLFNPDSSAVFATVKGDSDTMKLGSMIVWPAENGDIAQGEGIVSQFDGIFVNFGFLFTSECEIFLSDAGSGTALLTVGEGWKVTLKEHTVVPGQMATCWTEWEPALSTLYGIDAALNSVYTLDAATGKQTGTIDVQTPSTSNMTMGVFDSFIKNGMMYSLVGTNGMAVVDLKSEKTVQYLDLSGVGNRQYYQGLAQWP